MPMSKQIGILNSSEPFESLCGILTGCITINFYFGIEPKQFAVKTAVSPILIAAHRFFENLFHIIWICFPAKVTGGSFPARLSFYNRSLQGSFLFVGFLFYSIFILALKSKISSRAHARAVDVVVDIYIYFMVYLPKKWGIIVHLLLFLPKKCPFLPKKCTFMRVFSEEIPLSCTFMVISSEEINVISSEIMSKNSSFQPFQKIFEVLLS